MPVLTDKTVIMDSEGIRRALTRISHEIVERTECVWLSYMYFCCSYFSSAE